MRRASRWIARTAFALEESSRSWMASCESGLLSKWLLQDPVWSSFETTQGTLCMALPRRVSSPTCTQCFMIFSADNVER